MKLVMALFGLLAALSLQAGLGRIWPSVHRYVDILLVPVVWYGLAGTQRSAMFAGCAAGLLKDAWFQVGAFGITGFKRTLLGWGLGGISSRIDLNHPPGRFFSGAVLSMADGALDLLLRRLLDRNLQVAGPLEFLVHAVVTGLLVVLAGGIVERVRGRMDPHGIRSGF